MSKFTLQGTNTYIVGTGSNRILVDTAQGFPEWADMISEKLDELGISLEYVLLTHWHGDHSGGVPDLISRFPYLADRIYKNSPEHGQNPIEDGQQFGVSGATIRAVHTPGHSHDHMSFVLEEQSAMFTGDNVLGHGTTAVEELGTWMESLRVMDDCDCEVGYPAHGAEIPDLHSKIESELVQKERREKQILGKLNDIKQQDKATGGNGRRPGSVTVEELVKKMHGGQVDKEVRKMALEPFTDEVLRKMLKDGKVAFERRKGAERKWFAVQTV